LAAETYLKLAVDRLRWHLGRAAPGSTETGPAGGSRRTGPAYRLRELLDARITAGLTLDEAAALLHFDPAHLVRAFSREFGMPPHRYLTAGRVDRARRLLLDGTPVGVAATEAGFFDQSHLTRHFTRIVGLTPGRFARSRHLSQGRPTAPPPNDRTGAVQCRRADHHHHHLAVPVAVQSGAEQVNPFDVRVGGLGTDVDDPQSQGSVAIQIVAGADFDGVPRLHQRRSCRLSHRHLPRWSGRQ